MLLDYLKIFIFRSSLLLLLFDIFVSQISAHISDIRGENIDRISGRIDIRSILGIEQACACGRPRTSPSIRRAAAAPGNKAVYRPTRDPQNNK